MKFSFFCFITLIYFNAGSQTIDHKLFASVDAIVNSSQLRINCLSNYKIVCSYHYNITVLNPQGERLNKLAIIYNPNMKIKSLKGAFYSANGAFLRKITKAKNMRDVSCISDYSLLEDTRRLEIRQTPASYPYTIDFEYEISCDGFIDFPAWIPVFDENVYVKKSEYSVTIPKQYPFHCKELNADSMRKTIKEDNKTKTFHWEISNCRAIELEPYSPSFFDIVPCVFANIEKFKYEGYEASIDSWKNYGLWAYKLFEGRDKLSEATKLEIENITKDITDTIAKIAKIYKYMQSRTRYVSIQLGIGGYQPIEAQKVHDSGYGDCKALSNYMKALLSVVGIKSYCTLIGYGNDIKIRFPDFVSNYQTNHCILCIPSKNDTLWLECTNQLIPCGYIGSGNNNRYALLLKPDGGELGKTPIYNIDKNKIEHQIEYSWNDDYKTLNVNINSAYSGLNYEDIGYLPYREKSYQENFLNKKLLTNTSTFSKILFYQSDSSLPKLNMEIQFSNNSFSQKISDKILLPLKPIYLFEIPLINFSDRKNTVLFPNQYVEKYNIKIPIPHGYKIKYIPQNQSYKFQNVAFEYVVNVESEIINYSITYIMNQKAFSLADMNDFEVLNYNIQHFLENKVIFVRKL